MITIQKSRPLLVLLMGIAGVAAADTPPLDPTPSKLTTGETDPGVIDLDRADDLDSGADPWGLYHVSAAQPVSGLVRIGAHHARQWESNPDHPSVKFEISELANDWDIEQMGLEIKAHFVPGYTIGVTACARSSGNIDGKGGAVDTLTFSGASTAPETQLATFDPTGIGACKTVNVYNPVEAGADEYTIMIRPQLQFVQAYWEYTIYGNVTVEYYPILH